MALFSKLLPANWHSILCHFIQLAAVRVRIRRAHAHTLILAWATFLRPWAIEIAPASYFDIIPKCPAGPTRVNMVAEPTSCTARTTVALVVNWWAKSRFFATCSWKQINETNKKGHMVIALTIQQVISPISYYLVWILHTNNCNRKGSICSLLGSRHRNGIGGNTFSGLMFRSR